MPISLISFCKFVNVLLCVGLGIGLQCCKQPEERSVSENSTSVLRRFVTIMLAVAMAQGSEFIPIPAWLPILLFYLLVAVKIGIVIFLVVVAGFFTGANNHCNTKPE